MTELADKTLVDRLTEDLKPAVARLEELRQATVANAVLRPGIVAAAAMVGDTWMANMKFCDAVPR